MSPIAKRGPKTVEGKRRVSQNAFKHGISSEIVVIAEHEDPEEWEGIRRGVVESWDPVGTMEHMLAERIAIAFWKQRRIQRWQMITTQLDLERIRNPLPLGPATEAYRQKYGVVYEEEPPEIAELRTHRAEHARIIPEAKRMELIMRYESHYHRLLTQTIHELEALQTRRKGGATPLARLDITGAPGG